MLLRIGLWAFAAAVVVAASVGFVLATRDAPERPAAASVRAETTAEEPLELERSYRERPPAEEAPPQGRPAAGGATPLPAENPGWPRPEEGEIARLVDEPRRFAPDPNAQLTLTLPALGVFDAPVYDSDSEEALAAGVAHVPETSMPWDEGAQRNVYLAAHRFGYPGTGSRLLFYDLDALGSGDEVILEGGGETYRYRVTELFVADPDDSWVMGQVRDRDMVTLQTCTPIPTFEKRLVVRADRI